MSSIEDLESSIDIVDLVKRYSNLKKAWANYKAVCPFPGHNEKTPSFVVSPSKQLAYCFGCHRGGGPLKFIMDIENANFKEAVEILSNITWIKIKWIDIREDKINKTIYSIFKDVVNYYKNSLEKYLDIKKYLFDRWLSEETIKAFDFWYSDSWVELYNYLKQKWYEDELIFETNVFHDLKSKKDKFIWRIIFPIRNPRGDIVGLAWRIVWAWEPKYLNSPASKIYDKSSILYGLFEWRNEITKKDFVIVTEWYMDAISLHVAWYKNSVCVSGTALTEKHIWIIKRLTKRIYLCFDNDKAGSNATDLAIEMLKNKDLEVKVILMEGGKDPDEVIKSWGNFQNFIDNALSPIGWALKNIENISSLQDKKEILRKILWLIKSYEDNIEKDYYLKEISNKLDIKIDIVYLEYNKTRINRNESETPTYKNEKIITSEDLVIWLLIRSPENLEFANEAIKQKEYLSKNFLKILEWGIDKINEFDLDTKNFYMSLAQNDERLEIEAQIESSGNLKNATKIKQDLEKTIEKLNNDLFKKAESVLKEKIKSWDLEALKKYNELVLSKKK
jgi:DNA primase